MAALLCTGLSSPEAGRPVQSLPLQEDKDILDIQGKEPEWGGNLETGLIKA